MGIGEDARRIEDSLKKCKTENFEIAGYVEKEQRAKKIETMLKILILSDIWKI